MVKHFGHLPTCGEFDEYTTVICPGMYSYTTVKFYLGQKTEWYRFMDDEALRIIVEEEIEKEAIKGPKNSALVKMVATLHGVSPEEWGVDVKVSKRRVNAE